MVILIPNENPCGIPMDPAMKFMYTQMYGINPDECVPLSEDAGNLEIRLADKKMHLRDFLKNGFQVISLDNFSTQEINDSTIRSSRMPPEAVEVCKKLYIKTNRVWAVINHDGKSIGIAYRFCGYNGLPRLIPDPEQFINQLDLEGRYFSLFSQLSPQDMKVSPLIYDICRTSLHRDFLQVNPLSKMSRWRSFFRKRWGDKRGD